MADLTRLEQELDNLRNQGVVLPRHPMRAASSVRDGFHTANALYAAAGRDLSNLSMRVGRTITSDNYDSPEVQKILNENRAMIRAMGEKRGLSRMASAAGGDVMNAIPRFYDPLEYWDLSGLPWNVADEGHRHKLHKWLRLYYATHYLVPILVDIFTRFPLVGMELECKDPQLKTFYEDLFFDQLNYGEFLVSLGREFWCVGEAFPLGSFDEDLGVWEREELINPEDIVVDNFPLLGSQQLKIRPPDYLRKIAQTKNPAREWRLLTMHYPELIPYLLKNEHIPISSVLLRQVANKHNDWDDHGTPILLRGLRTLLHEEKLLASQDAIAERLYSPLILAKLGIQDMGDGLPPWLPGPEELESVREDFDIALSSDFRLLVHHFGLEVTSVFGREQMPRLGDDFDRIERRLMQVFGVNPSLLSAGSSSQPYASSALQAEFLNQILRTFQKMLIDHYKQRAYVVAEAQGHFDYITKGQTRVDVYETVVEFNEEGNKVLKEKRKLLIPELKFQTLDLRDEATERQFLQTLRQLGVPIPDQDLMVGVSWKIKDKIDTYNRELKEKTISQQQAKMDTYQALVIKGLPVPLDLKTEVESVLMAGPGAGGGAPGGAMGGMGGPGGPPGGPGGGGPGPSAGGGGGIVMPPPPPGVGLGPGGAGGSVPGGGPPPNSPMQPGPAGTVPQVSNERRPGLTYNTSVDRMAVRQKIANAIDDTVIRETGKLPTDEGFPVAFYDYVADNVDADMWDGDGVPADVAAELWASFPEHAAGYQQAVAREIVAKMEAYSTQNEAATMSEDEADSEPEEFTLKPNQELVTNDKGEEYVLEKRANKRIDVEYGTDDEGRSKKYSIIDPEAEPLESEENSESAESE